MKKNIIIMLLLVCPAIMWAQQRIDLSGDWKVCLGGNENYSIQLPNTLDGAGLGEANTLTPALTKPQLSRLTRKHSFIGQATYQREITITKEMAEPVSYIKASAAMLKALNTTITRFHWIQGEDMLNALDSLGILAQEELSWWQQPYKELKPEQEALAKETIAELIEAHYNHPCIFAWAVSNEVGDNHEAVRRLGAFIKQQDQSRMTETVGNRIYRYLENDPSLLLDIPTWNEYIGTWHGSGKKIREELPGYFKQIAPVLKGRPLFITEYGLCEPAFVGGDCRRIDDMLYHIKEWARQDFVTGYIYFCLEDYRTQMGEEGMGKHRIRRHGITDYRHNPKPSYYVLRDLMCPLEIDKVQPSTAVRDNNTVAGVWEAQEGDRTLIVGISVKNSIPSYVLRGYTLRYNDAEGVRHTITLPEMHPGQRYDISVPNINDQVKFDICRPDGGSCLNY